jgi:penicillin-binding protein 1A
MENQIGIIAFRVALALALIGGFAAMGAGAGLYMGVIQDAPSIDINIQPNIYTTIIYDSKNSAVEVDRLRGDENRVYIQLSEIPENLKNAFIAIEDERFYTHDGVDLKGMVRAGVTVIQTKGARTEGASTITQQLIKNNVMKLNSNTIITKLQEQYLAVQFEKKLTESEGSKLNAKGHILEVYLNTINLGHGYYGVQTGVKHYFNKQVSELDLAECAVIAAITQNPVKFSPDSKPQNNKERQVKVLEKMLELDMISQQEHDDAVAEDVYSHIDPTVIEESTNSVHTFFIDALVSQVLSDLQTEHQFSALEAARVLYNGGLKIYSTQDFDMQHIVDETMNDDRKFPASLYEVDIQYELNIQNSVTGQTKDIQEKMTVKTMEQVLPQVELWRQEYLQAEDDYVEHIFSIPQPQVAMVIMDPYTGYVKAICGGRGDKIENRTFNRATDAYRSPGSTFKILASYAPALDMGKITPSSILVDEPFTYKGYTPKNWWGSSYRGPQTVRQAIANSMNILAVKNMVNAGIDSCFDYLQKMHFEKLVDTEEIDGQIFTDRGPATALGGLTNGVSELELTAAYAAIANGGEYNKPVFYSRVEDHDGKILLPLEEPHSETLFKPSTAAVLTDMMRSVIEQTGATGTKAAFKSIKMPIAGKTGTSSETKDLTFVGYTPYYVAGIWGGYDSSKPMETGTQNFHLTLWSEIMEAIHKELPVKDFGAPEGVTRIEVCRDSGQIATDACKADPRGDRIITEVHQAGAEALDECELHQFVIIDRYTRMRASEYCPEASKQTIVGVVTEDKYVTDRNYQIPDSLLSGPACLSHGPNARPWRPSSSSQSTPKPTARPAQSSTSTPAADGGNGTAPPFEETPAIELPADTERFDDVTPEPPADTGGSYIITPEPWIVLPQPSYDPPAPPLDGRPEQPVVEDEPISLDDFTFEW